MARNLFSNVTKKKIFINFAGTRIKVTFQNGATPVGGSTTYFEASVKIQTQFVAKKLLYCSMAISTELKINSFINPYGVEETA